MKGSQNKIMPTLPKNTFRDLEIIPAYDHPEEICMLFSEYTDMLIAGDPAFKKYLDIQDYDEELQHLQEKYGGAGGRLYLAYDHGDLAGCIGLIKIDAQIGELKRLYVKPRFRGRQIGSCLIQQIIDDAKEMGYSYIRLDTLPFLKSALRLYQQFGFYEIPRYNDSPMETSVYLEKPLYAFSIVCAAADDGERAAAYVKKLADYMNVSGTAAVTAEKMKAFLESGAGKAVFGMAEDEVAAFLYYYETAPALLGERGIYIDVLYVEEKYRKCGIGRQMMDYIARLAVQKGCKRLEWACLDWNGPAMDFYRKLGAKTMDSIILHRMNPEDLQGRR